MPTNNLPSLEHTTALFIEMLKAIVEAPEQIVVTVEQSGDSSTVSFKSRQAKADVKRIIGKNGKTVQGLRRWLTVVGARSDLRYIYDVVED